MNLQEKIAQGVKTLGLSVSEHQLSQFYQIIEMLIKWNKAYNLTAIREPEQMVITHLLDSLSIANHLNPGVVLDVGTGPGFPGIPLSILFPERDFFLLDSNGKKTRYLKQLVFEMDFKRVSVLDSRVEEWQPERPFDVIVSRAFASLDKMIGLTDHLLAKNGVWQAMKGEDPVEELAKLPENIEVVSIDRLDVPNLRAERHLVTLKKKDSISEY
ncbi:16S rRNA (guanine(527)-N(7))-methyltransferase RsmG [Pleionea sediminis]|uniref:16S rRNA (guanine(527)-N(7))-methyltransferase RsmG n=1 Tax=Pleionea sediminis TaxID=2569479 RepID=UPI001185BD3D|nr:16S rRNA (guanine(527)-N(7))-methyltransferase RsmG [Pleionea sediminis]